MEFPYDDFRKAMVEQMGASESTAHNMNEFIKAMNSGKVFEKTRRDAESTTPTRIEDFAQVFARVYTQ